MPIYKYRCKGCGHQFEELVFGQKKIKCPKCQSRSLQKLISNISVLKTNTSDARDCRNGTCGFCAS